MLRGFFFVCIYVSFSCARVFVAGPFLTNFPHVSVNLRCYTRQTARGEEKMFIFLCLDLYRCEGIHAAKAIHIFLLSFSLNRAAGHCHSNRSRINDANQFDLDFSSSYFKSTATTTANHLTFYLKWIIDLIDFDINIDSLF